MPLRRSLTFLNPSQRRTVLFSDDATFPSKAKFVSETKKLLYRRYGVTAWLNQNQTHFAVLKCAQQQSRCSFRVRTEQSRGGTEWTLASGRCVWVHNHDMQGDEEERASWSSSEDEAAGVGSKRGGKASSEEERPLPAGALSTDMLRAHASLTIVPRRNRRAVVCADQIGVDEASCG